MKTTSNYVSYSVAPTVVGTLFGGIGWVILVMELESATKGLDISAQILTYLVAYCVLLVGGLILAGPVVTVEGRQYRPGLTAMISSIFLPITLLAIAFALGGKASSSFWNSIPSLLCLGSMAAGGVLGLKASRRKAARKRP